jgi:hypothetical protein
MGFCGDCGTHIYSAPDGDGPKQYRVRIATSNQRDSLPPRVQIWTRSAQPWVKELGTMPASAKQ